MDQNAPASASEPRRPPLAELFGLRPAEHPTLRRVHEERLSHAAATWPIALATQLAAVAALLAAVAAAHRQDLLPQAMLGGGCVIVAALSVLATFANPRLNSREPSQRIAIILTAETGLAAGLFALFWTAVTLPADIVRLTSIVAVGSAIAISAVTLHAIRATLPAFAAGIVLTFAIFDRGGLDTMIVAAAALWVAFASVRLARLDWHAAEEQAGQQRRDREAARMLGEFERHSNGWFWQTDRHGRLTYLSSKIAGEVATDGASPLGRTLTDVFQMDGGSCATERTLSFHLTSRTSFSDYSIRAAHGGADRRWSISGRPSVDELGRFGGFLGSGSDLTEQRRSEAEIAKLAMFDSLTGLANRQTMRFSLDKILQSPATPYRPTALFLMDLDRFKAVNDTLGHQIGDALLKQVAQRLQRDVGEAGQVGRLGGDEFQVLIPGEAREDVLSGLARTIIASVSQPYFIAGHRVTISCSIGIALALERDETAETLIRNADLALYAAKADGRATHHFYDETLLRGAQIRKQLEDDLRTALVEGAFHLVYQPVVGTQDARIVGYEALMRWNHPTRGPISPSDFIPVAEECGLIEAMGEWALRTACAEASRWPGAVRVAVNVSPIQFANPALPNVVTSALARSGLAPQRLELEITEGVFLNETAASETMFRALKGIGVRLALDDFGTGYSSLGYLRTAPFDKIKIDQSFVRGAAVPGNRNAAIIKAIVTLASTLGMETTAEGVEMQDEIALIRGLGCSHIQGYVYGKPVTVDEVMRQLAAQHGHVEASGHKVSRAPRNSVLRSARIVIGKLTGDVRIRNISTTGAMIDGLAIDGEAKGVDVLIELLEDQMFPAQLRWAKDGKVGLEFAKQFDIDSFNQPSTPHIRRQSIK